MWHLCRVVCFAMNSCLGFTSEISGQRNALSRSSSPLSYSLRKSDASPVHGRTSANEKPTSSSKNSPESVTPSEVDYPHSSTPPNSPVGTPTSNEPDCSRDGSTLLSLPLVPLRGTLANEKPMLSYEGPYDAALDCSSLGWFFERCVVPYLLVVNAADLVTDSKPISWWDRIEVHSGDMSRTILGLGEVFYTGRFKSRAVVEVILEDDNGLRRDFWPWESVQRALRPRER
jgi:hypothetical protein